MYDYDGFMAAFFGGVFNKLWVIEKLTSGFVCFLRIYFIIFNVSIN